MSAGFFIVFTRQHVVTFFFSNYAILGDFSSPLITLTFPFIN